MRISIRVKFFVVLLAFSLGPILLSRGIMGKATGKLAADISDNTRTELLEIVSTELEQNAKSFIDILDAYGQALRLSAYTLGEETREALGKPVPADGRTYFASDFADAETRPPDATLSEKFSRRTMSGKARPLMVSYNHPSVYVPESMNAAAADEQAARLRALTPSMLTIAGQLEGADFSLQVALESGVMALFPGRGGFHHKFDPRKEEWYKRAKESTSFVWTTPTVDPTTQQATATVSFPIRDTDGRFLGAASASSPISAMLELTDLKTRWSDDTQAFMVTRFPGDTVTNDGLLIMAQRSYDEEARHKMMGIEQEWMTSDDPEAFKRLLVTMAEQESGYMQMPYEGQNSLWAFANAEGYGMILIAPESVITRLPDHMARSLTSLFDEMRDISAIISGIMLIITGLIAWFGSRTVTKPFLIMADAATRLAKGDFSVRMDARTGDERDILIDSFNDMVPKLEERMHLRRDLELAQQVQELLLPRSTPKLSGYEISGGISYCDQTGGDYYDFIEVMSDVGKALSVVVGDVSGHGVPSALLMATARGQLHTLSSISMSPAQRISVINKFLSRDMDGTGRFLTMFYLRIKENDPTVRWVRAGHDPAIIYTPEKDEFSELGGDGLALGVLEEFEFTSYEKTLTSDDVLVISTDGVWEARNAEGHMFGKQRMLAIIRENAHKSAKAIRSAIMDGVEAYQANGQEDDIAVVVIKKD